ncbi:hypothetical protein VP719_21075 [Pseudomonas protegens]|uniref:hypothetical protein n=1 Tax=Pseudomonas protegens TaxID=380021 RepID=UPI002DB56483|nr:hypothetical protein [Pseudomonas protegens]WRV89426.1 hypothetical protein VP719_21075 [Pseudomonas protegens]
MSQVKERPILFSGPMVRAILEGQKTVTRRPIKPSMRGFDVSFELHQQDDGSWRPMHTFDESCMDDQGTEHPIACPYGGPGDRLWVRESLGYDCEYGHYFAAGGKHGETVYLCSLFDDEDAQTGPSYDGLLPERSVPSIHLHRRYSRILLEITAVRVERLQEITPSQCIAEGAWRIEDKAIGRGHEAVAAFKDLWQSTGGDWDANPWVWVVEFRRVQP